MAGLGQAQSLIVNGTFEDPASPAVAAPTGWTVGGVVTGAPYAAYGGTPPPLASNGAKMATFNFGDGPSGGSLTSTAFNLVAGQLYELTFLFGNFNSSGGSRTQSINVSSSGPASAFTAFTVTRTSGNANNFNTLLQLIRVQFTPSTSGSYTLAFTGITPNGNNSDGILDNVFLTRAVPELNASATLPFALLAVLGLSFTTRRRSQLLKV